MVPSPPKSVPNVCNQRLGSRWMNFGGDLACILKLPPQKAKKLLMRFPMIGEPGAGKILLFSGVLAVLALESAVSVFLQRATPRLTTRIVRRRRLRTARCVMPAP